MKRRGTLHRECLMSWLVAFFGILEFQRSPHLVLGLVVPEGRDISNIFGTNFFFFCFFLNKRHAHHTRAHRRCGFVFFNSIETGRVCDKVEVGGQVVAWHLHSAPLFDWSGQKKKKMVEPAHLIPSRTPRPTLSVCF